MMTDEQTIRDALPPLRMEASMGVSNTANDRAHFALDRLVARAETAERERDAVRAKYNKDAATAMNAAERFRAAGMADAARVAALEAALQEIREIRDDRFDRHEGYMSGLAEAGHVADNILAQPAEEGTA